MSLCYLGLSPALPTQLGHVSASIIVQELPGEALQVPQPPNCCEGESAHLSWKPARERVLLCGRHAKTTAEWLKFQNAFLQLTSREKAAHDYNQKLKEKFQHYPQIKRIARHRHLPKSIYSQIQEQRVMKEARRRKYVGPSVLSQPPNSAAEQDTDSALSEMWLRVLFGALFFFLV